MLRSILFAIAFIGLSSAVVLAIVSGHTDTILIASAFLAALAVSALIDDLRLVPPEAAAFGFQPFF